jgi:hypothetical protein
MRRIELEILIQLRDLKEDSQLSLDPTLGLQVSISQFAGIEVEEWPAKVAETAMFLVDHQMNLELAQEFGLTPERFPIKDILTVKKGNALQIDWREITPIGDSTFIFGNPPFKGPSTRTKEQQVDLEGVWGDVRGAGNLDYVTCWYRRAAEYAAETQARIAFVSTNSITQGQQPPVLWPTLSGLGFDIDFAHRTFDWVSEARGGAIVHVVIIGFSRRPKPAQRMLFFYDHLRGEPRCERVSRINAYLVDAEWVLVSNQRAPLQQGVQIMDYGSKPADDGYLSAISDEDAAAIRIKDPKAAQYLRPLLGADELINGVKRWCLWLVDVNPSDVATSSELRARIDGVRKFRLASKKDKTREDAKWPHLFQERRQPDSDYLAVPRVSSERRHYVPMALTAAATIANDRLMTISNADLYTFGVLHGRPFQIWNINVSGRLKSDFSISAEITYNNYPWPDVSGTSRAAIEAAATAVLAAREAHHGSSLADLYGPLSMPEDLAIAHQNLDKAVLLAYGLKPAATDPEVLSALFKRYGELVAPMASLMDKKKRKKGE